MAIAADPAIRAGRHRGAVGVLQPPIEALRAAADISVGGGRHLSIALGGKQTRPVLRVRIWILLHVAVCALVVVTLQWVSTDRQTYIISNRRSGLRVDHIWYGQPRI
jgi:hypothetical protein